MLTASKTPCMINVGTILLFDFQNFLSSTVIMVSRKTLIKLLDALINNLEVFLNEAKTKNLLRAT